MQQQPSKENLSHPFWESDDHNFYRDVDRKQLWKKTRNDFADYLKFSIDCMTTALLPIESCNDKKSNPVFALDRLIELHQAVITLSYFRQETAAACLIEAQTAILKTDLGLTIEVSTVDDVCSREVLLTSCRLLSIWYVGH